MLRFPSPLTYRPHTHTDGYLFTTEIHHSLNPTVPKTLCKSPPIHPDLLQQVASIQRERAGTEGLVAELGRQTAALQQWLQEHEPKAAAAASAGAAAGPSDGSSGSIIDADAAIVPADPLSRQALQAQAEDLAVEDCLLVLERSMLQGSLELDAYLKQVCVCEGGGATAVLNSCSSSCCCTHQRVCVTGTADGVCCQPQPRRSHPHVLACSHIASTATPAVM
jgi:Vps23 core domain